MEETSELSQAQHSRVQMDTASMPHEKLMRAIALIGTRVIPMVKQKGLYIK